MSSVASCQLEVNTAFPVCGNLSQVEKQKNSEHIWRVYTCPHCEKNSTKRHSTAETVLTKPIKAATGATWSYLELKIDAKAARLWASGK